MENLKDTQYKDQAGMLKVDTTPILVTTHNDMTRDTIVSLLVGAKQM